MGVKTRKGPKSLFSLISKIDGSWLSLLFLLGSMEPTSGFSIFLPRFLKQRVLHHEHRTSLQPVRDTSYKYI